MYSFSAVLATVHILITLPQQYYVIADDVSTFVRDLTHKIQPGIPVYPGVTEFRVRQYFVRSQNALYKEEDILTATHIGTHVDAPSHISPLDAPSHVSNRSWNIDEIPLKRLFAPAVVIDIRYKTLKNSDAELTVDDLIAWESVYGKIPHGAVILVLTGWDRFWKNNRTYLGIRDGRPRSVPGVSGDAAKWIVLNTKAYGVGIDAISIDSGDNVIAHLALLTHSLYVIENLKDLDKVPPIGATIYVMPIMIKNAGGAPARVIVTHSV